VLTTQVGIVGAGPAGLTLALLLQQSGIESTVIECRDRDYVERRIRAGLLEQNTIDVLHRIGAGDRLDREGLRHSGVYLRRPGHTQYIDMLRLTGRHVAIYGQQEVVKDLIATCIERGADIRFMASGVKLTDLESLSPHIEFTEGGRRIQLRCDFVAGCDGFHGVSRQSIPSRMRKEYDLVYHFSWLGILAEAAPSTDALIYSWHEHGFSLYSLRSPTLSRLYLQVPVDEDLKDWPEERIWGELQIRHTSEDWRVSEGRIVETGLTPMRSYVCDPMRYGRLFLAGDAAYIVPPTGAKGLNLAVNDVRLLAAALSEWYEQGSAAGLDRYSETALRRVWRAQDFSNYMTQMLHDTGEGPFARRLQLARLEYLDRSEAAARTFAENYSGLPATDDF
jgi:p-hydroxybenzoate 3-monooxygenase